MDVAKKEYHDQDVKEINLILTMTYFLSFLLSCLLLTFPLSAEYRVVGLSSSRHIPKDNESIYDSKHCVINMVRGLSNLGLSCTLNKENFDKVGLVHIEGLHLYFGTFMEQVIQTAKNAGSKISLDLGNPEIASLFRERILGLLTDTDILFINEDEAFALTKLSAEKAALFLKNYCKVVVIKGGKQGCWVASDKSAFHAPAICTTVIDAEGAGDLFTSAFLYGYLQNFSLKACARFGNLAGGAALEQKGADLPPSKWREIRQTIHKRH